MKIITLILTLLILTNLTSCKSPQKRSPSQNEITISENIKQEDMEANKEEKETSSKSKETLIKTEEKIEASQKAEQEISKEQSQQKAYSENSPAKETEKSQEEIPRPLKELEEEVIALLNIEREKEGLKPIKSYYTYYDCVLLRAKECEEYWSHTRPNGEEWYSLYFNNPNLNEINLIGENLGKDFSTAETIVNALMNSESHRNNILRPNFTHICVAIIEMKTNEKYPNKTLYAMAQHFYLKEEL